MTRNGASPIIRTSTINVIGTLALISASRIMLNKISSILSILSFVISITTIGAGYAGYKWITSPQFEKMMMDKVMEKVSGIMPKAIDNAIPSTTGVSIPFKK